MSWQTVKLGDVCDLFNGYAFKANDYVEFSNVLNCRMSNIRPTGQFEILYHPKYLPDNFKNEYEKYLLTDDDVIIAMTDLAGEPKILGMPTIVKTNGKHILLNQRVGKLIFKDKKKLDVNFLKHVLSRPQVKEYYKKFAGGGLQINLGKQDLLSIEIPLPPLAEQKRIAALLDTADRILKLRESAIVKLDQLAQSVFFDMFGDVVSNNKNWHQLSINEIAANEKYSIVDGPFGSSLKPTDYLETGVPVIRIANVTKDGYFLPKNLLYISKEKFKELKRSSVCGDDVLVTRVGTIGNTCIFPNNFGDALLSTTGVCKIKPNRELVMPSYLYASIKTKSFQAQINKSASTSVQKYFNLTALKSWKISIPPLHLQNEFIKKINLINDEITKHQQCLHQIKNLEFSLQHQSFAVNLHE